jgi:hypothetical protein
MLDLFRAHKPEEVEPASDRVQDEQCSERNSHSGREIGADLSMRCCRQRLAQAGGGGGFGFECTKTGARAQAGSEVSGDREGLILHGDRDCRRKDYGSEVRALILLIAIFAVAALFLKVGTDKAATRGRVKHAGGRAPVPRQCRKPYRCWDDSGPRPPLPPGGSGPKPAGRGLHVREGT